MDTTKEKKDKERRKLLKGSGRTVSFHARRVRRVRGERGKREGGGISLMCGRARRIRRVEGMGKRRTKIQRHRWVMASAVARWRRKGREEQRSSFKTLWLKD